MFCRFTQPPAYVGPRGSVPREALYGCSRSFTHYLVTDVLNNRSYKASQTLMFGNFLFLWDLLVQEVREDIWCTRVNVKIPYPKISNDVHS